MKTNTKHWASITAGILSLAGYASAANLGSEKYTYDASGNIIEKSIDGQVTKMAYDPSNRLTERQAIGQSKETTAYDAAGRPIAMKDGTGQPSHSTNYGYGDKVLETEKHGTKTDFYYNAEGQLVGKKTASAVATYTWDRNVLAADGDEAFTNEAHISGGVPVLRGDTDVVVSDYLANSLYSGDTQFVSTAYGDGLEQGRLTGKPFVKELGCFLFMHRLYSPGSGQWTVSDPSGFPDGKNSRAYVNGDPINNFDLAGLDAVIYHGHQDQTKTDIAYEDPINGLNGAQCMVSYTIGSDYNVVASAPSDPRIDPDLTQQTEAINPTAAFEGIPKLQDKDTDVTHTKYDCKVTAKIKASPSVEMYHVDFAIKTCYIEQ